MRRRGEDAGKGRMLVKRGKSLARTGGTPFS